jgi:2-oxoglutarate ferredoxin oxidoreductase subunit alpha
MIPVICLTDGFLANSAEPWRVPEMAQLAPIDVKFRTDPEGFMPYARDERLARPWALPGTPGLEHRVGGLEKSDGTGHISYDPENHERMSRLRHERVQRIADELPPTEIHGETSGDLLVVGWGGTFGAIRGAVEKMRARGHRIGHVHLRNLNPFPNDFGEILRRFDRVLVPEMNLGQLVMLIRARYLVDAHSYPKIQGQPFKEAEIVDAIQARLEAH